MGRHLLRFGHLFDEMAIECIVPRYRDLMERQVVIELADGIPVPLPAISRPAWPVAASRLHGEGYRKLWARLRFAGVRASPRRVRRVMRENGLLAPHRVGLR
jgi:hypothetical protein